MSQLLMTEPFEQQVMETHSPLIMLLSRVTAQRQQHETVLQRLSESIHNKVNHGGQLSSYIP